LIFWFQSNFYKVGDNYKYLIALSLLLFACNDTSKLKSKNQKSEETLDYKTDRTPFLIDYCNNLNYNAVLEEDINKGNDTCILRITSSKNEIIKLENLNLPIYRSSFTYCEKEYVIVGSTCGGSCYSEVFIFLDNRKNRQFYYCQKISNNSNLIAHIKNEEFKNLIIHNLKNDKELTINIPDNNWMNYGQMDTLFASGNNLIIEYQTEKNQIKKKIISIDEILK